MYRSTKLLELTPTSGKSGRARQATDPSDFRPFDIVLVTNKITT